MTQRFKSLFWGSLSWLVLDLLFVWHSSPSYQEAREPGLGQKLSFVGLLLRCWRGDRVGLRRRAPLCDAAFRSAVFLIMCKAALSLCEMVLLCLRAVSTQELWYMKVRVDFSKHGCEREYRKSSCTGGPWFKANYPAEEEAMLFWEGCRILMW